MPSLCIPEQEDDAVGAAIEGVGRLLAGHVARDVQRCLPEGVPDDGEGRRTDVGSQTLVSFRLRFSAMFQFANSK